MIDDDSLERYEEHINFRLFSDIRARVREEVELHPSSFENESHFYRVAVMRLLRDLERDEF